MTLPTLACLVPRYIGVELTDDPHPTVRIVLPDSPWRRHLVGAIKRALEDAGVDLRTVGAPGQEALEVVEEGC
jgi:hypothetical protein